MNKTTTEEVSKEKLVEDLRVVVKDAEELLQATAGTAGDKIAEVRDRVQKRLVVAKENLATAQESLVCRTKEAARVTDDYVHDHPWRAVGVAAGVGLVVGVLITRGR